MKKYLNILVICLISICLFDNVSAANVREFNYSDDVVQFVSKYSLLLDNVASYIKSNASSIDSWYSNNISSSYQKSYVNFSSDKNVIIFDSLDVSSGFVYIQIVANGANFSTCKSCVYMTGSYFSYSYLLMRLSFNLETYEITGLGRNADVNSDDANLESFFSKHYIDYRLGSNTDNLFYNSSSYDYVFSNSIIKSNSYFDGSFYDFVSILDSNFVVNFYDLGSYNDSNIITYKINDSIAGNDKSLNLKLTFKDSLDISSDDISIYKYGSNVYTQHGGFSCENIDLDSVCTFNLKYNVYDNISDKIFFDLKFNKSYNVIVSDDVGSNNVYSNHTDVDFDFKSINLKEKSSVLFYLRNYDIMNYLYNYYNNDFILFNFYSSSPSSLLFPNVIYPNDIRYSNTYFLLDSNNQYNVYADTLLKINNFGYFYVPFKYDSSLLSDNKYSSFYISNPNYLGSGDTDNQDLYISYNSTLFDFVVSDVVYNNSSGSFLPGNTFDSNIDFTYNNSQNNYVPNSSNWISIEFDKKINTEFKYGLQYFKNKIIDMFDLVSEFYYSMPDKFRVWSSLIFILLIGVSLFRLLL